ncbi:MAG: hypothetical protein II588_02825, partial [Paludibacteraceae bacterium]|nr:hypothetical protein [Paludibacteraceae bacterium]
MALHSWSARYSPLAPGRARFPRVGIDEPYSRDGVGRHLGDEAEPVASYKCEVEAKFVEADLAQKKIAQLIKVKNKKNLLDKKSQTVKEKDELERIQKEELDEFNKEMDKKFYELNGKFQEMQTKLEEEHNSQLKDLQKKYEEKYSNYIIKPSSELIDLNKKLELYVQRKDYKNAHQTQIDIANLTKKEKE